ncbi:MAG: cation-translocating P-type ATPase [Clostridia bacterium]|nr:cation-translocating P-type ATPase [Clostridia bacterium]
MIKKIVDTLESVPATVIAGICLLADLIPHIMDKHMPFSTSWITAVICGVPIIYSAIKKLIKNRGIKRISSALLISIAMVSAIAIGDIFAAGEVVFIMAIGEILEDKTTKKARKGLKSLISLTPQEGRRIVDGKEEMIPYSEIKTDDILRILPGETIPVDGEIINGETSVDESVMTGEALPVDKCVGDTVFSGTINRFGVIEIRASKVGEDSSLQKLIRMVRDAEDKKAPTQRVADIWASYLVPVALLLAVIAGFIKQDIVVSVTILVVFCPCALVLATPTAIMAAIGQATKHGVIIKSGEALEKMGKVDTVAFDKTGTLTYGKLEVCDVLPCVSDADADNLLTLTASVESMSEHPLGKAIVAYAKANNITVKEPQNFHMIAGKGVSGEVSGTALYCGNERYLEENGIILNEEAKEALFRLQKEGKASVITATANNVIGIIALSDVLKPDAENMIKQLAKTRTNAVLLTGDTRETAEYFSEKVGIKEVFAGLLPEDKVRKTEQLQNSGRMVCMIGDGVNDAPALKVADVGVAMGNAGSDIAIDAADITLIGDDIAKIPYLKRLSDATVRTIRFGITLSLLINLVAIILSFMSILTPVTGALVHNGGSFIVILIAALLYDRKFIG